MLLYLARLIAGKRHRHARNVGFCNILQTNIKRKTSLSDRRLMWLSPTAAVMQARIWQVSHELMGLRVAVLFYCSDQVF